MPYKNLIIITHSEEAKKCWEKYFSYKIKNILVDKYSDRDVAEKNKIKTYLESFIIIFDITKKQDWVFYLHYPILYYTILHGIDNISLLNETKIKTLVPTIKNAQKITAKSTNPTDVVLRILDINTYIKKENVEDNVMECITSNSNNIQIMTNDFGTTSENDRKILGEYLKNGGHLIILTDSIKAMQIYTYKKTLIECIYKVETGKSTTNFNIDITVSQNILKTLLEASDFYISLLINARITDTYLLSILENQKNTIGTASFFTIDYSDKTSYKKAVGNKAKNEFNDNYRRSINNLHLFIYDGVEYIKYIPNDITMIVGNTNICDTYFNELYKFIQKNMPDSNKTYMELYELNKNIIHMFITQWLNSIILGMLMKYNEDPTINFHTHCSFMESKNIYILDLKKYTFSCIMYVRMYDMSPDYEKTLEKYFNNTDIGCDIFNTGQKNIKYSTYMIISYLINPNTQRIDQGYGSATNSNANSNNNSNANSKNNSDIKTQFNTNNNPIHEITGNKKLPDTYMTYSLFKIGKPTDKDLLNSIKPPNPGKNTNNTYSDGQQQVIDILDSINSKHHNQYAAGYNMVHKKEFQTPSMLSRSKPTHKKSYVIHKSKLSPKTKRKSNTNKIHKQPTVFKNKKNNTFNTSKKTKKSKTSKKPNN